MDNFTLNWKSAVKSCIKLFLVLLAFAFSLPKNAVATHGQGADITYQCLGNGEYELQLSFYRDCGGVAAPASVSISASSVSCGEDFNVTLDPIAGTGQDVTPVCSTMTTECDGGSNAGVEEYIYKGTVTLPAQCDDWVFDFSLCCRNNAITNIDQPGNEDIYVEANLDNQNFPCNSSPVFSNPPIPFICVGQEYCFNHGATDADGDSLSYSLIDPMTGPTTNVTYLPGFSANQPISSNPNVSMNPETGDICMTPTQQEVTVMAVEVEEWRNGQLVGTVVRDIQVQTISCSNEIPEVTGIDGSGDFTLDVCANETVDFSVPTLDADALQDVTLTWNSGIPGASFNPGSGSRPTGQFTWTTDSSDVSSTPHCFTVTVEDNNCPMNGSQTYSFCITVNGFNISTSSTPSNCGASNGKAFVSASGGAAPYSYQWSTGGQQSQENGLTVGTYTVQVTDSMGCTMYDTVDVGTGALPGQLTISTTDVSCYGENDGTAEVNVNGGQSPYSYQWSNGDTTALIQGLSSGTYSVAVTTVDGCTSFDTISISAPNAPLSMNSFHTNVSCYGGSDGSAGVNVTGGTTPYQYNWSPSGATSSNVNGLSAGIYEVTVTDSNGCTVETSIKITEPEPLGAYLSANNVSCNGGSDGSAMVDFVSGGTPPYAFSWNTNPAQTGNAINQMSAGNYTVTITDSNGCTLQKTAVINEPAPLAASMTIQDVSCNGVADGEAAVSVSGGVSPYQYSWNTSPSQSGSSISSLGSGSYIVTVSDGNGCMIKDTAEVTEPAPLSSSMSMDSVTCFQGLDGNAYVNISGGTQPYSYVWNGTPSPNAPGLLGIYAGWHKVKVTDDNGCMIIDSVKVEEPLPISIDKTIDSVSCYNGNDGAVSLNVSGGNFGYQYNWSMSSQNTDSLIGVVGGAHYVTVSDAKGCSKTIGIDVPQPDSIRIFANDLQDVSCYGDSDGSIEVSVQGGTPSYSYQWNTNPVVTDDSISNLSQGTYTIDVVDQNGCANQRTFTIDQPSELLLDIPYVSDVTCNDGNDGIAHVAASGGTTPYVYQWNTNPPQTGSSVYTLEAGNHPVTVTDKNGCTADTVVEIDEPSPIQMVATGDTTVCPQTTVTISANASGGSGGYILSWGQGLGSGNTKTVSPPVTTDYTVVAYDSSGCIGNRDTVTVDVIDLQDVNMDLFGEGDYCKGSEAVLSLDIQGQGNFGLQWSDGLGVGYGPKGLIVDSTNYYSVTLSDQCDNEMEDSVEVRSRPYPNVNLTSQKIDGCEEVTTTFSNDSTADVEEPVYNWNIGGSSTVVEEPTKVYKESQTIDVMLEITSRYGCFSGDTVSYDITVFEPSEADFEMYPFDGVLSTYNPQVQVRDESKNAARIKWNFGKGDTSSASYVKQRYERSGTHQVELTTVSDNGCKDTMVRRVFVGEEFSFYVPNAFTPDGDGENDKFHGKGQNVKEVEMSIYNRWGEKIYYTESMDDPWRGRVDGEVVKEDVYIYEFRVKDHRDQWHKYKGHVSLLK